MQRRYPEPTFSSESGKVIAALLDFEALPGRYPLTLREPRVLFDRSRDVLLLASGRPVNGVVIDPLDALDVQRAACFFVRMVMLRPGADHYTLLGLEPGFKKETLREQYRMLIRLTHPDFAASSGAWPAGAATRINLANDVLSSAVRKAEYDALLSNDTRRMAPMNRLGAVLPRPMQRERHVAWGWILAGSGVFALVLTLWPSHTVESYLAQAARADLLVADGETGSKESSEQLAQAAQVAKKAEAAQLAEAVKQAQVAKLAEAPKVAQAAKEAPAFKTAEAAKEVQLAQKAEAAKRADVAKQAQVIKIAEEAKVAEAAQKAQAAKDAQAVKLAEATRKAEAAKLAEVTKLAQAVKLAQAAKIAEAAKEAQAAKDAQAVKLAEAAKETQLAQKAEAVKLAEATKQAQMVKLVEAAKIVESAKVAQAAKDAEALKLAEVAKQAQVVKLAEAAKVAQAAKDAQAVKQAEATRKAEATKLAQAAKEAQTLKPAQLARAAPETPATQVVATAASFKPPVVALQSPQPSAASDPVGRLTLADAQPALNQLIQAMQAGRGEDLLRGLDRSVRQSAGAADLVNAYNFLVDGSRSVRLGPVQLRGRPNADQLAVDGVVQLVLHDQGQPPPVRELRLRALFAQRDGQVVITELSAGGAKP